MEWYFIGIIKFEDLMIFLFDYEKIIYDIELDLGVDMYNMYIEGFDERRVDKKFIIVEDLLFLMCFL